MARYRVCFDGKWQGDFDDARDALTWAREVGETGRMVHVVRGGFLSPKLVAVFPESKAEEGRWLWKKRAVGANFGGGNWT